MQKSNFKFLLVAMMIAVFGSVSSFAQQTASTDKKSLILEFRKLTGADKVNLRLNFSIAEIQENLLALVEQDKEITDAQKTELKKSAKESGERLDNEVKAFFTDQSKTAPVAEEIIYQLYDKTFTEVELRELITFYRTPTGQKALVFLPSLSSQVQQAFTQAVIPMLQNFIQPKIQAETEQLKQKLKDAKAKKSVN
ncbi:MAG: DUF2059 domain-containing protein [Acidobacteria bacterium]|jgi:hypothetical protein|nr:DUF2059 domain-containing protein [Acidobacteriota bacterium]